MMPTTDLTTHVSQAATRRTGIAGLIAALALALASAPAFADAVRLHDQMGVQTPEVTLVQVAELTGERAEALGEMVVGAFEGRERIVITLDDVRRALDERDVNWGRITLRGHRRCEVIRLEPTADAAGELDGRQPVVASNIEEPVSSQHEPTLRGRIEAMIAELAGVPRDELRIAFRAHDERRLSETTWTGRFEIEPGAASAIGRVPLTVRQYQGGRPTETFTLTADVQRRVQAIVVTRMLRRGDRFERDAIELREVWLDDDRQPLAEPELVVGQQVGSTVRAGAPVYADDVRSPVLVRRGELVTVRALSGGLVVRTVGRASEEGAMDETIRLRNEGSRETFYATVTGRREATVALDQDRGQEQEPAQRPAPPAKGETVRMSLNPTSDDQQGGER